MSYPMMFINQSCSQPKSAAKAEPKPATAVKGGAAKKGGKKPRRGRNAGRGKPKTAEELDAEMVDYWDGGANANASGDTAMVNGGAVQPASGDAGMEDEIMVSLATFQSFSRFNAKFLRYSKTDKSEQKCHEFSVSSPSRSGKGLFLIIPLFHFLF
jgi:hypothetical protein